tara:strand:+ start:12882 stop:13841 length:960 start_codon:yes stop_codon:yes gene_type:complete
MKVIFRLNAGKLYGIGHLSRNLVLSTSLNKKGVQTEFIIKSDDFHFIKNFIKQNKKIDYELIQDSISTVEDLNIIKEKCIECKFLIIDHYEHNNTHYNFLKKNNIKWAQYDHGANKKIFSDVVINPNLGFSESDYKNLVSDKTIICAGNKYLLINKSIRKISNNNASKKNILIAMGGGNYPEKVRGFIKKFVNNISKNFIIISSDIEIKKIKKENVSIFFGNLNFKKLYSNLSFALVSGGVTSQEMAFLNIPMLIFPYSSNQKFNAENLTKMGYGEIIDSNFSMKEFNCNNLKIRKNKFIDGKGSDRLANLIRNFLLNA